VAPSPDRAKPDEARPEGRVAADQRSKGWTEDHDAGVALTGTPPRPDRAKPDEARPEGTPPRPDRAKPDEARPEGRVAADQRSKGWAEDAEDNDAVPQPHQGAQHSLAARLARVQGELGHIATDGLRLASMAVAVLFVAFSIYSPLRFPPAARVVAVVYDLALVAASLWLWAVCRRRALPLRTVCAAAAGLSFAVLGNVLVTGALGANPYYTFCVAILLIASAGTVLSAVWAIAIGLVELVAWGIVAAFLLPASDFEANAFVMAGSVGVAFIVHVSRHVATVRILELRDGDARRELALQQALAEADEGRRELDRKVEERTAALRNELQERALLEEQLRQAQKMEAVGRLAGGIAHDFNNLLNVIRLSHLTICEPGTAADELREALRDASDATDRAAALTHDLLAFARKQTLQRTAVAVTDVIGGVERMVRRVAEAGIRLEVRIAPEVGEIVADRHQIEQVLLNLAINACDAMGDRGTLTVTADTVEVAGARAGRRHLQPGTYVRVAVSDTGCGMDEATRRSVFEPFFTTKEVGRGTGLGLAVAHGIVTQHSGQITVESEPGKGSTFTVFLPRARAASPQRVVAAGKAPTSPGGETVLVVEDEAAVRRAVQRNLERLGYRVLAASDGEDALRIAEPLGGVDLLLSDVVMPGIDGPELACRLRERWPDLPVLFVTGYSADRLARSGAVGPHDRVLEKPYQLEELARTLRRMLEERASRGAALTA
jgi:signal transduction histidine kinase/ActR/RegA family two-component response regulator